MRPEPKRNAAALKGTRMAPVGTCVFPCEFKACNHNVLAQMCLYVCLRYFHNHCRYNQSPIHVWPCMCWWAQTYTCLTHLRSSLIHRKHGHIHIYMIVYTPMQDLHMLTLHTCEFMNVHMNPCLLELAHKSIYHTFSYTLTWICVNTLHVSKQVHRCTCLMCYPSRTCMFVSIHGMQGDSKERDENISPGTPKHTSVSLKSLLQTCLPCPDLREMWGSEMRCPSLGIMQGRGEEGIQLPYREMHGRGHEGISLRETQGVSVSDEES